jgi:hypothetical protein
MGPASFFFLAKEEVGEEVSLADVNPELEVGEETWLSDGEDVWVSDCDDVWVSDCAEVWVSDFAEVWVSDCAEVWPSDCAEDDVECVGLGAETGPVAELPELATSLPFP